MRLNTQKGGDSEKYKVIVIDDDPGIIDTLKLVINKDKYSVTGFIDPNVALKEMHNVKFDIMILDFLLDKITGREVVEKVREFNNEIYIILLTGYNDMAPPIESLVKLDIQGYCEKSNHFDLLTMQLESAVKSIILTRKLIKFHEGISSILGSVPGSYSLNPIKDVIYNILKQVLNITKSEDGFIISCRGGNFLEYEDVSFVNGIGTYDFDEMDLYSSIVDRYTASLNVLFEKKEMFVDGDKMFLCLENEFNEELTALVVDFKSNSDLQDIIKVFITNAQSTYSNAILHTIVNKKNSDLHAMVDQLEKNITKKKSLEAELLQTQKMDLVGRLTGGIVHDFNNILQVISGYSSLILKNINKDDPHYKRISAIDKAGQRASDLINQLMTFSRKQNLNRVPFSMNTIILSLNDMVAILLDHGISFTYDLDPDLWQTMIDKTQMEQVFLNLIVNAKDAIDQKGVITISSRNVTAENSKKLRKPEMAVIDYVQLTISDTGHGIDPSIISNIYEPFFTTKSRGKGTGLGLSTVYGIVKQMEGFIYVESEINKGATFTIYLPRAVTTEVTIEDDVSEVPVHGIETVLVVDDQEEVNSYVGSILTQEGYTVYTSSSPREAIQLFNQKSIDLVISDMIMPEMNGKQLIKKLIEIKSDIRFLFMSGYVNDDLVEQGLYYSRHNFIEKPFSSDKLLKKIRKVLQRKTEAPMDTVES